jgi:tripartite-type tricarboxylate transporter receptor subunit TctC
VRLVARGGLILFAALFGAVVAAAAERYPDRPIRFILPFAAGGPSDIVARVFAARLSEALRQQVVVDNRGGASGLIAYEIGARAIPDGYTLLLGVIGALSINPNLYAKLPYDAQRDFAPISLLSASPYVLVVAPGLPAHSVKELVAFAGATPGGLNYASGGVGTGNHLSAELFKLATGLNLTHVPYKGASQAVTDVMSGRIQLMFINLLPAQPYIKAGRMRALAVTSARRSAAAPDIPTMIETGVADFEVTSWHGLIAPAKTPGAIIRQLHAEVAKIARRQDTRELLGAQGSDVIGSTPEEFASFIKSEITKWGRVIKAAGIKPE